MAVVIEAAIERNAHDGLVGFAQGGAGHVYAEVVNESDGGHAEGLAEDSFELANR